MDPLGLGNAPAHSIVCLSLSPKVGAATSFDLILNLHFSKDLMMSAIKNSAIEEDAQGKSIHASALSELVDDVIREASRGPEHLKAEYIAMKIGVTPGALANYRSGSRPLPAHIVIALDNLFGEHRFLAAMAAMEGIVLTGMEAAS